MGLEQGVGDVVGFKMVSAAQVLTAVLSDYELASRAHVTQLAEILVAEQRNQVRWMAEPDRTRPASSLFYQRRTFL